MKRALVAVLFGCMTLGIASFAMAGDNDQAAVALHITPFVADPCNNQPALTAGTIVSEIFDGSGCTDEFLAYTVWALVCNGSDSTGVSGAEFGITYNPEPGGLFIDSWVSCADLDFPNPQWPDEPGTGILVTWDPINNCQIDNSEPYVPQTVIAMAGAFRVFAYAPDIIDVIPRPANGLASVSDCSGAEESILGNAPSHLGRAGFCLSGYNPCGIVTPVQDKTWGAIKQQFESN